MARTGSSCRRRSSLCRSDGVSDAADHRPVLLEAVLAGLAVRPDGHYLDATFGRGGHSAALLERLGPDGRLLAVDRDPDAVAAARERFETDRRFRVAQGDFAMLREIALEDMPAEGFAGILLDLGVSSPQLDRPERGFSFRHGGPLDMRMDPGSGESAAEWLARVDRDEFAHVIRTLGEERFARRIARAITAERDREPIETTDRLAAIVAAAVPRRERDRHPATRTFQAIRMAVNRELESLDSALEQVPELLAPGGRLAVISFHSLEDRRVKRFIRANAGERPAPERDGRGRLLPEAGEPGPVRLRPVGKPVTPDEDECRANPRARSARLRIAERPA